MENYISFNVGKIKKLRLKVMELSGKSRTGLGKKQILSMTPAEIADKKKLNANYEKQSKEISEQCEQYIFDFNQKMIWAKYINKKFEFNFFSAFKYFLDYYDFDYAIPQIIERAKHYNIICTYHDDILNIYFPGETDINLKIENTIKTKSIGNQEYENNLPGM